MESKHKPPSSAQRFVLMTLGACIVCIVAMLSVASTTPSVYAPHSVFVIFPALFVSIFPFSDFVVMFLGALPITLVYLVCLYKGSKQPEQISNLSIVLITALALACVIVNAFLFSSGAAHQGLLHVIFIYVLNGFFIVSIPAVYWRYMKNRNLLNYTQFVTLIFIWLAFCAFPWLGPTL
uniref:hypothetical protein n=1 Tax=Ningiella ruwaisensis TaxID=2364274 RepID=UPI0019D56023|nr:hypothetical protein [Ningiella ruwaisensis]